MSSGNTWSIWPDAGDGLPPGPRTETQRLMRWFEHPEETHHHGIDFVLARGGRRSGKCFKKGTKVILFDGSVKTVEDILVGDLLLGPDSQPRRVESLARGREEMFEVKPRKGKSFICNGSHTLALKTSGYRVSHKELPPRWDFRNPEKPKRIRQREEIRESGTIKTMSVYDYLALSKRCRERLLLFKSEAVEFGGIKKNLDLDPYFLGLWLGYGSARTTGITNIDEPILRFVREYSASLGMPVREYVNTSGCLTVFPTFGNTGQAKKNPIYDALKSNDLLQNKHIPSSYLRASITDRLQLLAGIIDTDGALSRNSCFDIIQKNGALAEDIVYLCRSLGLYASIRECRKYCIYKGVKREGTYHRITISGQIEKIPTRLQRKQAHTENLRHRQNHSLDSAISIKSLGEDDYYGFEVSGPDRLFLLDDFTVVHNSLGAVCWCLENALYNPGFQAIVGAKDTPQLERTSKKLFRERLTLPGGEEWNHPLVIHKPTDKDKRLILRTWNEKTKKWDGKPAQIWFIHFGDAENLKGAEADMILVEEPDNLPDKTAYMRLIATLTGKAWKYKQVLLMANPGEFRCWLDDEFQLDQFSPDYDGPPVEIGQRCQCHICDRCRLTGLGEFQYVNGECSNENCAAITKLHPKPNKKHSECPGNQQYHRVLRSSTLDNPTVRGDVVDSMLGTMDKTTAEASVFGREIRIGEGFVYHTFSYNTHVAGSLGCILKQEVELDPRRPVVWSGDWNVKPQCSGIIQEQNDEFGDYAVQIDEIVKWNAEPHDVAKHLAKYLKDRGFTSYVEVYGDPTGVADGTQSERSKFKQFMDTLKAEGIEAKYKVGKKRSIKDSVQDTNACLMNAKGQVRFFINKRCKHTILSFQQTEWDKDGKWQINKQCDQNAFNRFKREPEETMNAVVQMTHPSDAIRYYLMVRFASWKNKKAPMFVQFPGESVIEQVDGKVKEKDRRPEKDRKPASTGDSESDIDEKPKKTNRQWINDHYAADMWIPFSNNSGGFGLFG